MVRVAVLGVGSDLRGDDAAGVLVARQLARWCERRRPPRTTPAPRRRAGAGPPPPAGRQLAAFDGGTAPESVTGVVARFRPDLVVLVDAARLGREPGAVELVSPERIDGLTFSTHMLPAPLVLGYLAAATGCRTLVLGIQLAHDDVLALPSPPVRAAVRRVVAAFRRACAQG